MEEIAKRVFDIEIASLRSVAKAIDSNFTTAVNSIIAATGRVVIIGIGKSGIIGKKITATFASTGTPSFFLHPGEAFHGDLGMVSKDDIVIMISYSGETEEVVKIIPFLKWNKNIIIAITGSPNSTVAKNSNIHLNIKIVKEACPLALAPTSSTTAALVMGDALAIALMETRQFQHEDFARFHPGGSLGYKLIVKVKDVMRSEDLPFVDEGTSFTDLLLTMSEGRLGMVIVGDAENVKGVITDGDLRRSIIKNHDISLLTAVEMMTSNPVFIDEDEFAYNAKLRMNEKKITAILVGSETNRTIDGVYQIYN